MILAWHTELYRVHGRVSTPMSRRPIWPVKYDLIEIEIPFQLSKYMDFIIVTHWLINTRWAHVDKIAKSRNIYSVLLGTIQRILFTWVLTFGKIRLAFWEQCQIKRVKTVIMGLWRWRGCHFQFYIAIQFFFQFRMRDSVLTSLCFILLHFRIA